MKKAPAEVVKINVGALKGACVKIKHEKSHYYQKVYVPCFVPVIASHDINQLDKKRLLPYLCYSLSGRVDLHGTLCKVIRCQIRTMLYHFNSLPVTHFLSRT